MEITAYGLRYRVRAHEKGFFPEDAPRPVQPGCPRPCVRPVSRHVSPLRLSLLREERARP